jgi:large subunit ribosomal protein L4
MARTAKTKPAVKKVTKVTKVAKATKVTKVAVKKEEVYGLSVTVVGTDGKSKGKMSLPKEVFGEKMNKQLVAQAVRVYLANQREGGAATKTRGMVEGSTRKIYKQKGTGRARHGNIRAPIFVGGGIVFGPVPHDFSLSMPTRMRRKALACALTSQFEEGNVIVVDGFERLKPKTKFMAEAIHAVAHDSPILLVTAKDAGETLRITRNIESVDIVPATDMTAYEVLAHKKIVFMKDAVGIVAEIITKKI